MTWYYSNNNQRFGPVGQAEFDQRVQSGEIRGDTLVWREGMTDWQPWSRVSAPPPPQTPGASPYTLRSHPPETSGGNPAVPPAGEASAAPADGRPLELEFSGSGGEYFRIWIVNLLLTIVTFGIYAAWAKVRTRRYFYTHTRLAGHAFEYLAEPKRILIGNLIVIGFFILFQLAAATSPLLLVPLYLVGVIAVPWVIVKSIQFNAHNSAWRGLRFGFGGTYGGALKLYLLLPMLIGLTLGLIWPYIVRCRREWLTNHYRFGTTPFQFGGEDGEIYKIYLKAVAFFAPLLIAYGFIAAMIFGAFVGGGRGAEQGPPAAAAVLVPVLFLAGFGVAFIGSGFLRARLFNYFWNHTGIGPHRFLAVMRARDLIRLQVVNVFVTLITLGLAWPWVAVRTARFQLDSLAVLPGGDLDSFVGQSQAPAGALAEAAGDFLDIDIGFGL